MPKLSIIIPVYNVENYLRTCLESLREQTFQDWEAIVINDGSTDESGKICNHYASKDKRFKVFHQENKGVGYARNFGLNKSQGEYITFIDSDDVINKSFLANFSFDPSLDFEVQGFRINYINSPQKNYSIKPCHTKVASIHDIYAEIEYNKLSRGPVCKLMKRQIITENNIRYPEDISFGEDAIFVKRYLLHCDKQARSIAVDDYLYNHYDNSNSLTSRTHHSYKIYNAAWCDYQLFLKLKDKFGGMPEYVEKDYKHIRTLEFYSSIVACIREKEQDMQSREKFISKVKKEMYKEIENQKNLPPTYWLVRFCMNIFPVKITTVIFNILFNILLHK